MHSNANIAEFNNADGLTPQQVFKLNYDFKVLQRCYDQQRADGIKIQQNTDALANVDSRITQVEIDVDQLESDVDALSQGLEDLGQDIVEIRNDILVINGKLERSMHYRGAVANPGALPSVNVSIGDVYYVNSDEEHMVWTGSSWLTIGGSGGSVGTTNYNDLINKPQINSVTLMGNKTFGDLGLSPIPQPDIWALF